MSDLIPATDFLSPERAPLDSITQIRTQIVTCGPLRQMLQESPVPLAILNGLRQMVYSNPAFLRSLDTLERIEGQDPIGMRLGEIWHCMQAANSPSGCGTSYACRGCHISNTLLEAMKWGEDNDWERIQRLLLGSFEVEMRAKYLFMLGEMFLLCRFGYEPYRSPAATAMEIAQAAQEAGADGEACGDSEPNRDLAALAKSTLRNAGPPMDTFVDDSVLENSVLENTALEDGTLEYSAANDTASENSEAPTAATAAIALPIPPEVPESMVELYSFLATCGEF